MTILAVSAVTMEATIRRMERALVTTALPATTWWPSMKRIQSNLLIWAFSEATLVTTRNPRDQGCGYVAVATDSIE